jgi:ATP-binding cassette subfamily G (WHITE) protein 2 (PDR)
MSLLGTINPNLNPGRTVRGNGGPWQQEINNEQATRSENPLHGKTASIDTNDTIYDKGDEDIGNASVVEAEVGRLARRLTRQSTHYSMKGELTNPFVDSEKDSTLNPHSPDFSPRRWMKTLLAIHSGDPEKYPQRTAGVSFRNLSVHGFGSPTDYQKDVGNVPLQIGTLFRHLMGTGKQKIQILRDFDGLVKSGEMLVVLGRPGRYAGTAEKEAELAC